MEVVTENQATKPVFEEENAQNSGAPKVPTPDSVPQLRASSGMRGGAATGLQRAGSLRGGGGVPPKPLQRTNSMRGPPQRASSMRGPSKGIQRTNSLRGGAPNRAIQRASSMRGGDAGSSMKGTSMQRASSSRVLLRGNSARNNVPRRAPPIRTNSIESTNSMQSFRRDQMNIAIEPKEAGRAPGPGGTLQRHESGTSEMGDLSCYTMDSVNLRKAQLVADPVDDGTYNDCDFSYAEHDSVTRCSEYTEHLPGDLNIDKLCLGSNHAYECAYDDQSYSSLASGLTNDFEMSEFGHGEFDELEEEEDPAELDDLEEHLALDEKDEIEEKEGESEEGK